MDSKVFIGSGKAHSEFDSVTVTLDMAKLEQHVYTTERGRYITFVVSRRKEVDQYGKTHSAFVMVKEAAPVPAAVAEPPAEPVRKTRKGKKA